MLIYNYFPDCFVATLLDGDGRLYSVIVQNDREKKLYYRQLFCNFILTIKKFMIKWNKEQDKSLINHYI